MTGHVIWVIDRKCGQFNKGGRVKFAAQVDDQFSDIQILATQFDIHSCTVRVAIQLIYSNSLSTSASVSKSF